MPRHADSTGTVSASCLVWVTQRNETLALEAPKQRCREPRSVVGHLVKTPGWLPHGDRRRLQKPSRAPLSWLVGCGEFLEGAECFWGAISPGSESGPAREPAAGGTRANLLVTQSPWGNRTLCRAEGMRQLFTAPSSPIFHSLSIWPAPPSTHTASPLAFRSLPHFQSRFLSPWKRGFKSVRVTLPYLLPLLSQGKGLPDSHPSCSPNYPDLGCLFS